MNKPVAGFVTMAEFLVVLVILGVLVALVVPKYMESSEKGMFFEMQAMLKLVSEAQEVYLSMFGVYTDDFDYLNIENPNTGTSSQRNYDYQLMPPALPDTLYDDFIVEAERLRGLNKGDRYRMQKDGELQGPFNP